MLSIIATYKRHLTLALAILVSLVLVAYNQWPTFFRQDNSANAAYNVGFTNFWVGRVTPGVGHIGVDIWWPSGGGDYNPCHHSSDIYYGACVLSNNARTSYYKVMSYTTNGTDFPYGIFIDNENENTCWWAQWCTFPWVPTIKHGWGRLVTDGSLEIYPHDNNGNYNPSRNTVGGVRINSDFFLFANGGRYSKDIGNIDLPQLGQANVGKMNGFATINGVKAGNNRVLFEIFQHSATRTTSTGYPMTGFSVVRNNSDGYYNTGALPGGSYKIYITDTQTGRKIILEGVNIFGLHERLDFKLDQRCFGIVSSGCTDPAI